MSFSRWLTGKARVERSGYRGRAQIRRSCIAALALLVIFGSQVALAITITSFTPTSGNVGTAVTINGTGFNTTLASDIVKFNGTVATVTSATTIKIIATVPSGASTGRITVTIGGSTATSSTDFTVKPQVLSFTPASGPVGTPITIHGEGFSPTLANNAATVHSTTATVSSATATQLVVAVPAGATTGTIKVTVGSFSSTSTASFTVTPSITGFSPPQGTPNTPVTISGYTFSATRTSDVVKFNGATATVTSATTTQLIAKVPSDASTGPITVTVSGSTATSATSFGVPPTILSTYPLGGSGGDEVDITGTGFSPVVSEDIVDFHGVAAEVESATTTDLIVVVPETATTGPINVTVGGFSASSDAFNVFPSITGFSPTSGAVGTPVTVEGHSFSPIPSENTIQMHLVPATAISASPTELVFLVPSGAISGVLDIRVGGSSGHSSTSSFTVLPEILSFSPTTGPQGTSVTIVGEGFSTTTYNNTVTFNGTQTAVSSAGARQLVTGVPLGASTGPIQVTVAGNTATSSTPFIVAPKVTGFSPASGAVGTTVTVQGLGFDSTPANNQVSFNGIATTVTAATTTQLTVSVPSGANTGPIQVIVNGQAGRSDASFVVTTTGSSNLAADGPSIQASTSVAGQNIVLTFDGTAGQYLGLGISMTTSPANVHPTVSVLGPSGAVVPDTACNNVCSFDLTSLPATGTYTITANPRGSATMNLIATLSTDVMGTIVPGTPYNLAMPRPGQVARLEFEGTVGAAKVLDFSNILAMPSGEIVQMKVAQPDGSPLIDAKALARAPIVPKADGIHTLIIERVAAATNIAATISLAGPVDIDVDGNVLDEDSRWSGSGNVGLMTFAATAGQDLGLGLVIVPDYPYCCDASEDASVFVYGPHGDIVFAPDQFVTADGSIVILGHSCTNFLGFPGCAGKFKADETGTYTIYVTPTHFRASLSTPLTGELVVDGPAFLYDPRPGQQGRLTFQGAAGQDLQLQWDDTIWSPDYSPVTVTNPDGSELTELFVPQSGHSAGMSFLPTLPATGTYVLDVGICCGQVTYWPVALATQTCTPPLPVVEPSSTTITSITPNPVALGASYTVTVDVKTCSGANPPGTVWCSKWAEPVALALSTPLRRATARFKRRLEGCAA